MNNYEESKTRLDEITTTIQSYTEPKDKQKEIKKFIEELTNLIDPISKILNNKIKTLMPKEDNSKIIELGNKIDLIKKYQLMSNLEANYKEKLGLKLLIHKLSHPNTLIEFNNTMKEFVGTLKNMGVNITKKDFDYTPSSLKYMDCFFQNINLDDSSKVNDSMKLVFESMYWNNHNFLKDIALNARNIVNKHEKEIFEYIKKTRIEFFKTNNITEEFDVSSLEELNYNYYELQKINTYNIFNKFLNKQYNIDDFLDTSSTLLVARGKFIEESLYQEESSEDKEKFMDNVYNLYLNLDECEQYEEYNFLTKYIIDVYNKKSTYKGLLINKQKEIAKLEGIRHKMEDKYLKLSKKYTKVKNKKVWFLFSEKRKNDKLSNLLADMQEQELEINSALTGIATAYMELDKVRFEDYIVNNVKDNYSIYDVLLIFKNNYVNLLGTYKEKHKDIKEEELNIKIKGFDEFLNSPYNKITKTIKFLSDFDIVKTIEEKYRLLGFDIKLDKVGSGTFNDIKKASEVVSIYRNISESGLTPSQIKVIINNYLVSEENT